MNMYEWLETILFFVVLLALIKPLGAFMAKVYQGERTFLSPVLVPCENLLYRICGVKKDEEMDWKRYAWAMLLFNLVLFVGALRHADDSSICCRSTRRSSRPSPGNWRSTPRSALSPTPTGRPTAVNRPPATSPRWSGLAVHNFVSAATGMAIVIALIRGFVRRKTSMPGQLLGRYDPRHPLHPAADVASSAPFSWSPRG